MTDRALDGATTFIILSYARPQNIQPTLETILQARSCARIVLSNNNPAIDINDHIALSADRLTVLQQQERWPAIKWFCLAREEPAENFICIDDDLFLTAVQIDGLASRLLETPAVPHGSWGANVTFRRDPQGRESVLLEGGIHNHSGPVRIINRAYAFTAGHVRRFFELLAALGIDDPRDLGPADDILLSHSGNGLPL